MSERQTGQRSWSTCGSALTKPCPHDLQTRATGREANSRIIEEGSGKGKKKKSFLSLQPRTTLLSVSRAHSSDGPTTQTREEGRMGWGAHEREGGLKHGTERTAGENEPRRHIRCWVRTERDITEGGKRQRVGRLHVRSDCCTHPGPQRAAPRRAASPVRH